MNYTVVLQYIIKTLKGQTDFTHIHHCYGFFWDGPLHLVKSLFFREALSLFGGDDLTIVCLASYVFPLGKPQEQTGCLLSVRRYGKAEPHCVSLSGGQNKRRWDTKESLRGRINFKTEQPKPTVILVLSFFCDNKYFHNKCICISKI